MAKKVPLQPENFELETNTVWAFPDRGKWATHDAKYRGNWSPYIPRNLILRYSQEGDTVLDPFVGGGTTAVEAKLTNRNFVGFDINPNAVELSRKKCEFQFDTTASSVIDMADARKLPLADNSVDLICSHPPYADIIHYSDDIEGDLSLLPMKAFLFEMGKVADEFHRVLKKDRLLNPKENAISLTVRSVERNWAFASIVTIDEMISKGVSPIAFFIVVQK